MRLVTRRDTALVAALIVGALVAFERPLRRLLDLVHDLELQYQVDLLPAFVLLTVALAFHQHTKRVEARLELAALARERDAARERTRELEQLMAFGAALAHALDRRALEQALWRALPGIIGDRECSVLWRQPSGVDFLLRDTRMLSRRSAESIEALLLRAGCSPSETDVVDGDDLCVPLYAGDNMAGAIVVRNVPELSARERAALGAAAGLVAVACRNAHLLHDARQSGIRDGLTGCVTRAHGLDVLQSELRRSCRTGRPVSVIMFDVDGFKRINDTAGHLQGDAILASVGAQLNEILRSTDTRCRYGGDEFLLILPDTPMLGAQQVAECLRREIAAVERDGGLHVTASIGVASAVPGEMDPAAVIARADEALYRAKRAGRNRCCVTFGGDPSSNPHPSPAPARRVDLAQVS